MASLTTTPPPAKRQRPALQESTIEALQQKRAPPPIKIGILVLPAGFESACGIMLNILQYLDIRTLCNVKRSSLIQQCRKRFGSDDFERVRDVALRLEYEGRRSINELIPTHPARRLYLLIERYQREFPRGTLWTSRIPTPFVCACQHGRLDDVKLFVNLHPYHKYITNRDVNCSNGNMAWKEYVNQEGRISHGGKYTPLMTAAKKEHFHIVQYLIEQGEADPTIGHSNGRNALHLAASYNKMSTDVIRFLLEHISINSINQQLSGSRVTPLDQAYQYNFSPIRQEIIALIRKKGGKANHWDANGRLVGEGNGDLND